MYKPRLEDKDKVAKVYNSKGEVCETFSFRDHGNSYLSAAQNYLMQNYDKLMAEEVEQMDEAKWRDPKLKGKTFMNPRAVNRAPKDRSEYYGGDMNNPGELRGDEKIPLNRKGEPEDGKDRLADRANLPKRTRDGQKFPRVGPLKQAIMNKEEFEQIDEISQDLALRAHAKANDVTSRRWNDKFAGADLADKGSQGMFHHSSSGEEAADRTAKRLRERIGRKFGPEAEARAKRSEFGVVAPANTTPKKKSFLSRLGLTKEGVEQMDEAATRKEVKKVYSKKGNHIGTIYHVDNGKDRPFISAEYHHGGYLNNTLKKHKDAEQWIHDSHSRHLQDAQMRHDKAKLELRKYEKRLKSIPESIELGEAKKSTAWASYNKSKAETKSENTMYNNMLTKLEEGRGRPPKPGSEAWKRRQSAAAAGGAHVETPHIATQLMKHADYGFKNHTYKFSDGSTHEITPTQRDTVLRKLRSMTGPGKKPEDREKMYDEINTPVGFFHHTGDKPIASKKLHPMSAQKE